MKSMWRNSVRFFFTTFTIAFALRKIRLLIYMETTNVRNEKNEECWRWAAQTVCILKILWLWCVDIYTQFTCVWIRTRLVYRSYSNCSQTPFSFFIFLCRLRFVVFFSFRHNKSKNSTMYLCNTHAQFFFSYLDTKSNATSTIRK